jgi:hypothetical protein
MLIEVEVSEHQIPALAEQIAEQPVTEVNVLLDDSTLVHQLYAGRFVGAQQVYAE